MDKVKLTAWRKELVQAAMQRELAASEQPAYQAIARKPAKGFAAGDRLTSMSTDKSRARI